MFGTIGDHSRRGLNWALGTCLIAICSMIAIQSWAWWHSVPRLVPPSPTGDVLPVAPLVAPRPPKSAGRLRRACFDVSTDGFQAYETAIDAGLYDRANHAAVVKMYRTTSDVVPESYRPAKVVSLGEDAISGNPDSDRAGTSHVERKNGTLRQWCRRLTRLTYAFSRSWDNLRAELAIHFEYYNPCRIHGSLRITAAGTTDHVWDLSEIIAAS